MLETARLIGLEPDRPRRRFDRLRTVGRRLGIGAPHSAPEAAIEEPHA
jgi:hypothetical protein